MTQADHQARITRLRDEMRHRDVEVTLLGVGADLRYLVGYHAEYSERLTMAVVPSAGDITLLVPALEAPRVDAPAGVTVRPWGELDDPLAMVASHLDGVGTAAFGDHTWARFLLGLQHLTSTFFVPASPLFSPLRIVKDGGEIAKLAGAAAAADRVAHRLGELRFTGRTERQIAAWIGSALVEEGCERAAFAIVASGPNAASPHHEPGDREIGRGDTVVCDFGGTIGGYSSDTTRTFSVGEPTAEVAEAYAVLSKAQQTGVDTVAPGTPCEDVDRTTRSVIEDGGFGDWFIHRTGHGIGLDVHEDPYLVEGNRMKLEPGMAFSVEPGIYLAGRWGMRIEDIVVCGEHGGERLNESSRRLVVVG